MGMGTGKTRTTLPEGTALARNSATGEIQIIDKVKAAKYIQQLEEHNETMRRAIIAYCRIEARMDGTDKICLSSFVMHAEDEIERTGLDI